MLSEFSLIDRFFARRAAAARPSDAAVGSLGIGDDCALLAPRAGEMLAISTDMLVEGRHFFADVDPEALGHKALAVNLSDLAAMGAQPQAFTLAFSLPKADEAWLAAFSEGLFALAGRYGCELIGGDTTGGPLNLCITVFGSVPPQAALRRDAAQPGDDIWISGTLGDARAGLGVQRGEWSRRCQRRCDISSRPRTPGAARRARPRAARHRACGARPLRRPRGRSAAHPRTLAHARHGRCRRACRVPPRCAASRPTIQRRCTLAGGDDYELCFTAPVDGARRGRKGRREAGVPVTRIGTISALETAADRPAIDWRDAAGAPLTLTLQGFDHFHAD